MLLEPQQPGIPRYACRLAPATAGHGDPPQQFRQLIRDLPWFALCQGLFQMPQLAAGITAPAQPRSVVDQPVADTGKQQRGDNQTQQIPPAGCERQPADGIQSVNIAQSVSGGFHAG